MPGQRSQQPRTSRGLFGIEQNRLNSQLGGAARNAAADMRSVQRSEQRQLYRIWTGSVGPTLRLGLAITISRLSYGSDRVLPAPTPPRSERCLQPGRAFGVAPARDDVATRGAHARPGLPVDEN